MGCCNSLNSEPSQLLISEHYDPQQRPPLIQNNNPASSNQINQVIIDLKKIQKQSSGISESVISSIYEADHDLPLPDITNDNPCGFLLPDGQGSYLT